MITVRNRDGRRIVVSLICFVLAGTVFTTFNIYLDSYSIIDWNYETKIGPSAMILQSSMEPPSSDRIMEIEGITKAASIRKAWGTVVIFPPHQNDTLYTSDSSFKPLAGYDVSINTTIRVIEMNQNLIEQFPSIYNLTEGRWPLASDEVACAEWLMINFDVELGATATYRYTQEYIYHTQTVGGVWCFIRNVSQYSCPSDFSDLYRSFKLS